MSARPLRGAVHGRRVYLAGPDVFLRDAEAIGAAKKAICAAHGLVGLFPLDDPPAGDTPSSAAIYARCLAMMRDADAIVANLTPFRGIGADAGTAFELGFMAALAKPLFGYSNVAATILDRTRAAGGITTREGVAVTEDGGLIEDFGLFDNLMLAEALLAEGGGAILPAAPVADPARDLGAFALCVAKAAAALQSGRR